MARVPPKLDKERAKIYEKYKEYLDTLLISENTRQNYRRIIQTFLKNHRKITQKTISKFLREHPRQNYLVSLKYLCRCLNISNIEFPSTKRLRQLKPRKEPLTIPRKKLFDYLKKIIPLAEEKARDYEKKAIESKKKYFNITDKYAKDFEKRKNMAFKEYKYYNKKYTDYLDLKVILLLLLDYGTRIREILELRTTDINFSKKKITFHTKTHKDRILNIKNSTLENLKNLINIKGLIIPSGDIRKDFEGEFIFYSHYTEKKPNKYEANQKNLLLLRKLKYDLFRRDLSALLNELKLPSLVKTHLFRRSLINYLIEDKNLDIFTVANFMEQSPQTAEKYLSEKTKEAKKKKVFEILSKNELRITT